MKRDMDTIRHILLVASQADGPLNAVDGVQQQDFYDAIVLLEEAGLAKATTREQSGVAKMAILFRLTWDGHELADSLRDDTLWKKAKDVVLKPSGSWSVGVLRDFAKAEITRGLADWIK